MTPTQIAAAERLGQALNALANRIEMQATERNRAAAASFATAQDHHHAIVFLMKNTFYSSSFALLRCLFEAYLRGLWLKHCATDAQVSSLLRGEEPPKTLVAEIEATPAFTSGILSRTKRENWRAMCAFTHTGGLHLQRWQTPEAIEPSFEAAELEQCLHFAELFGAMATLEMIQMDKAGNNGEAVLALIKQRWP